MRIKENTKNTNLHINDKHTESAHQDFGIFFRIVGNQNTVRQLLRIDGVKGGGGFVLKM